MAGARNQNNERESEVGSAGNGYKRSGKNQGDVDYKLGFYFFLKELFFFVNGQSYIQA